MHVTFGFCSENSLVVFRVANLVSEDLFSTYLACATFPCFHQSFCNFAGFFFIVCSCARGFGVYSDIFTTFLFCDLSHFSQLEDLLSRYLVCATLPTV